MNELVWVFNGFITVTNNNVPPIVGGQYFRIHIPCYLPFICNFILIYSNVK